MPTSSRSRRFYLELRFAHRKPSWRSSYQGCSGDGLHRPDDETPDALNVAMRFVNATGTRTVEDGWHDTTDSMLHLMNH
eukprot:6456941-Amphidinium_carterae.1